MADKIVLITGASSGIGKTCAEYLAAKGYTVYGASRNAPFPPDTPKDKTPIPIKIDIRNDESVQQNTLSKNIKQSILLLTMQDMG